MADRRWAKLDSVRNDVVSHLANVLGDKSFLDSLLARKCLYYDQYEAYEGSIGTGSSDLAWISEAPPAFYFQFCRRTTTES